MTIDILRNSTCERAIRALESVKMCLSDERKHKHKMEDHISLHKRKDDNECKRMSVGICKNENEYKRTSVDEHKRTSVDEHDENEYRYSAVNHSVVTPSSTRIRNLWSQMPVDHFRLLPEKKRLLTCKSKSGRERSMDHSN